MVMSDVETLDGSRAVFSSSVAPSAEDLKLWDSLTEDEKAAVIDRELAHSEASGVATLETMASRIERVRKSMGV